MANKYYEIFRSVMTGFDSPQSVDRSVGKFRLRNTHVHNDILLVEKEIQLTQLYFSL